MNDQKDEPAELPVTIPVAALSAEALEGIIKDFVLREGTDYGAVEYSLDKKIEAVKKQLASGEATILYDAISESCTIALKSSMTGF